MHIPFLLNLNLSQTSNPSRDTTIHPPSHPRLPPISRQGRQRRRLFRPRQRIVNQIPKAIHIQAPRYAHALPLLRLGSQGPAQLAHGLSVGQVQGRVGPVLALGDDGDGESLSAAVAEYFRRERRGHGERVVQGWAGGEGESGRGKSEAISERAQALGHGWVSGAYSSA